MRQTCLPDPRAPLLCAPASRRDQSIDMGVVNYVLTFKVYLRFKRMVSCCFAIGACIKENRITRKSYTRDGLNSMFNSPRDLHQSQLKDFDLILFLQ